MTDLLTGTDLARVPLPDGVVGFGFAEMRYLLSLHDGERSALAQHSLGLDGPPTDEWVCAAGVSSLMARGLVATDGERATSRGEAAMMEVLFATGHRWSGIGLRSGDDGDLLVVIEAPGVVGVLQPRTFGTWFVGLTADPAAVADPADVVAASLLEARRLHPEAGFAMETRTLDGVVGRRYARPAPDGWQVSATLEADETARRHVPLEQTAAVVRAVLSSEDDQAAPGE